MTTKTAVRIGGGARARAWCGAAGLAALLCAGCASGPDWWRPPRPKAGAAAVMPAGAGAGGELRVAGDGRPAVCRRVDAA